MNARSTAIAEIIDRDHDPDVESIEDFVRRVLHDEQVKDVYAALQIVISHDRIWVELTALLDCLETVRSDDGTTSISEAIKQRRAAGYSAEFEALLARTWICPHCDARATVATILIPIGSKTEMPSCTACRKEGISPIDGVADLELIDGGVS